jgi:hypothetical protein
MKSIFINFFILFLISINNIFCSLKFKIPKNSEKCFIQQIFLETSVLIRFDLSGFEEISDNKILQNIYNNLQIYIKNQNSTIIYRESIKKNKGKFVQFLKEPGIYFICSSYVGQYNENNFPKNLLFGIKITNEYESKDINKALNKDTLEIFNKKIKKINNELIPSMNLQKKELEEEDETSRKIISASEWYFNLTVIQILLIILVAFYYVLQFKKYLTVRRLI